MDIRANLNEPISLAPDAAVSGAYWPLYIALPEDLRRGASA